MAVEAQIKNRSSSMKEFESLLNEDFKDRKLQENQIIKATVTEITKNFIVVDCKAKMEGMIPVEEFKNNNEVINKANFIRKNKTLAGIFPSFTSAFAFSGVVYLSEKIYPFPCLP